MTLRRPKPEVIGIAESDPDWIKLHANGSVHIPDGEVTILADGGYEIKFDNQEPIVVRPLFCCEGHPEIRNVYHFMSSLINQHQTTKRELRAAALEKLTPEERAAIGL